MHFKITEPAEIELQDAYEYYETQSERLGEKFINSFRSGIDRILCLPEAWSPIRYNVRKCVLDRFPYSIIYALEDEMIIILAIAHHHRMPEYWIDRLN